MSFLFHRSGGQIDCLLTALKAYASGECFLCAICKLKTRVIRRKFSQLTKTWSESLLIFLAPSKCSEAFSSKSWSHSGDLSREIISWPIHRLNVEFFPWGRKKAIVPFSSSVVNPFDRKRFRSQRMDFINFEKVTPQSSHWKCTLALIAWMILPVAEA